MFLLSDFYYQGVGRPFDYVAIIVLVVLFVVKSDHFRVNSIFGKSFVLLGIVAPWMFFGALFNESILMVSAMLLGVVLIFPICYELLSSDFHLVIEKQINFLIMMSALILLIQASIYYGFGLFIDVPGTFGAIESRGLNEGLLYFRPSGMFQEPNAFCTAMFCMVSACSFFKKRNLYIEIAGISSIILTQSLWGFVAAFFLIYLLYGFRWLVIIVAGLSVLAIIIFSISEITFHDLAEASVTLNRIINIDDDPSRQARFGSIENVEFDIFFFLGHGVDSNNFQSMAANGLSFLLYSFGVVGSIAIILFFFLLSRMYFRIIIAAGFLFTTFPVLSYMFFWGWLGLIFALAHTKRTTIQPQQTEAVFSLFHKNS